MAASDARPLPLKNTAYRLYFPMRKTDGSLVTSWTGMDTEISKDGGAFADATNEATEIGTSGVGYIDLTAAEMNADAVVVKVLLTNTNAMSLVLPLTTVSDGEIPVNVTTILGQATTVLNDTYQALVWYTDSEASGVDRYGVVWLKNGVPVPATSPTIAVTRAEGSLSLIAQTAMAQVGTSAAYYYTETTNRMVDGHTYLIAVTAVIDGATRHFLQFMSRDSAAV